MSSHTECSTPQPLEHMIKTLECICPGANRRQGRRAKGIAAAFSPAVSSTWKHEGEGRNCSDEPRLFKRTVGKTRRQPESLAKQMRWARSGRKPWFWGHRRKGLQERVKATRSTMAASLQGQVTPSVTVKTAGRSKPAGLPPEAGQVWGQQLCCSSPPLSAQPSGYCVGSVYYSKPGVQVGRQNTALA